jgi:hypothetical protein
MRLLKIKSFNKWATSEGLSDATLYQAVCEMTHGLIDADLGGGIVKKRIALPGRGKRGGARTLLATNLGDRWIFLYGFTKGERTNITETELAALKRLGSDWLGLSNKHTELALAQFKLHEIHGLEPKSTTP